MPLLTDRSTTRPNPGTPHKGAYRRCLPIRRGAPSGSSGASLGVVVGQRPGAGALSDVGGLLVAVVQTGVWVVLGLMEVSQPGVTTEPFEGFLVRVEERLRLALIASYGPDDGQAAAWDALSWAWEHWDRVQTLANPVGFLYRVGQSAARRHRSRPIPIDARSFRNHGIPEIDPGLVPALAELSIQQRTTVLLVHAFGWTIRDVASLLEVAPSTVQTHVERGLARLRTILGGPNDG